MRKQIIGGLVMVAALAVGAAEWTLDLGTTPVHELPKGFRKALFGGGQQGKWEVVVDESGQPLSAGARPDANLPRRAVLAQLSQDPTDERYPLLIYEPQEFGDFTFSVFFKIVSGSQEQMAGIIFRAQNEKNFYVFRANAKDGNVRFYKVVDGNLSQPLGRNMPVTMGQWHELKVVAEGNIFRYYYDGTNILAGPGKPDAFAVDNTFGSGKVGFWTKSDSVAYFVGAHVNYKPRQIMAQTLVDDAMKKYNRLHGLKLYAVRDGRDTPVVVASNNPKDIGQPGGDTEKDILARGKVYHLKGSGEITVFMPLHDRNGDVVAVVAVTMETFWGQTEQNAIARALPIVKYIEARSLSLKELLE